MSMADSRKSRAVRAGGFMAALVCASALVVACPARAASFDIQSYCREVAAAVGGSYQIEEVCREQEVEARRALAGMSIEPRIESYCTEVADAVGGSYQIMLVCVEQETGARDRMN